MTANKSGSNKLPSHPGIALISAAVIGCMALPVPALAAEAIAVLPGSAAQTQSKIVCSKINWLTSLDAAREQAKKEHKLIVWIHMLGNIDGFT